MASSETDFNAVVVEDILDEHGGIIKNIRGADLSNDTVAPQFLFEGKTAHDSSGNPIVGIMPEGSIGHCVCFDVKFEDDSDFEVIFDDKCDCFCIDFGEFIEISDYEFYDGEYIVTPTDFIQMLDTDDKVMRDDVTVLAVPYTEVDNPYGGVTCIIG